MRTRWLALALLLAGAAPAGAQEISFTEYLVQVKPGPKRYFYADANEKAGCPALTAACRRKAYVVPGNQLVSAQAEGDFTFVTFISAGGAKPTWGWMETAALRRVIVPAPRLEAWIGGWYGWDGSIDITRSKRRGQLHVEGSATWGSHDPERVARGGINLGDFEHDLVPRGDRLIYPAGADPGIEQADADDCHVDMQLLGPYLSVVDNNHCGGLNVSFTGVYRG